MKDTTYYYAVTRVHNHELNLLSGDDLRGLRETKTLADTFNMLKNKGWGNDNLTQLDIRQLCDIETKKIWDLMSELIGDVKPFYIFRYKHDYNNLKAAIKLNYAHVENVDVDLYFLPYGTIKAEVLLTAVKNNDFSLLPNSMAQIAKEATKALIETGSGQNCDIIIDAALLEEIYRLGRTSGSELLKEYAIITVDIANIKTAIRGSNMEKSSSFFGSALANAGTLSKELLENAASLSIEDVYEYLRTTDYSDVVDIIEQSVPAFEAWCDNRLMEIIRPQRHVIEGIDPLAAFILARENEINMVKLILSSKINKLDTEKVSQRMREMYV